ncbi:MAG TPA: magnesium transporter CorA family protein [Nitrososphaeraceae archaeon]|nr:magnesium transporter CorA family protein [Nitrososphaeraceae archaeon]
MAMLFLKTMLHSFMDSNLTISAYLIDKNTIKEVDFSNPIAVRQEMVQNPEESLWIHGNEPEDVFPLQGIFGLHPLSVEAVTHQNQPSKIEKYDEYLFTIIDGIRYDEREGEEHQKNSKAEYDRYDLNLIEDDLYIFLEQRWIVTINFHNQKFQENIRKRIKNLQQQIMRSLESKQQQLPNDKSKRKDQMTYQMCEIIYRLAIEESIASYYPIVDKTNKQLEQIEESILNITASKTQLSNIISLRRKISFLEGTLGMVSRAFDDIINTGSFEQTKLSRDSRRQIRSLDDKVTYLRRDIENMHQRVISLREAYNSSLTANLNETIRTLTVIATIVLPLTLISGIYGMNFDIMPELRSPYGYYYALGLMAAVGGGMIGYFKWKRWI